MVQTIIVVQILFEAVQGEAEIAVSVVTQGLENFVFVLLLQPDWLKLKVSNSSNNYQI